MTTVSLKNQFISRNSLSYLFYIACFFTFLVTQKAGFEWKWSHLFFSYEQGFLKRGLIGEIFNILAIPTTWDNFAIFSALLLTGVIVTFHQLLKNMDVLSYCAFAVAFIGMPVFLRNLAHDWGRFDQIALIFVFLLLFCLNNLAKFRLLLCISPLLLFIHEATLLWVFPTVLVIAFFTDRKSAYLLAPVLLVCMAVILQWGNLDIDEGAYMTLMSEWASPIPIYPLVVKTLTESPQQVIAASVPALIANLQTAHGMFSVAIMLSVAASLFFIRDKVLVGFSFLSLLSACILFIVAVDFFRWISLLCFIVMFYLLYAHQRELIRNKTILNYYLILLGFTGLFFDPVGIHLPYTVE